MDENSMNSSGEIKISQKKEDVFREIFLNFKQTWDFWLGIYDITNLVLMSLGLIGGILALTTLLGSSKMRTPSFSYHKVLVFADMVYCLNWFIQQFVDKKLGREYKFHNRLLAFYSAVLFRVITSVCGYTVLYMTLFIALDRFLGLVFYWKYKEFNKTKVSRTLIFVAVSLSLILHSWTPWVEQKVVSVHLNNVTFYSWKKTNERGSILKQMFVIKNIYNGAVRISYPFVLSVLTAVVCYKFSQQNKRRKHLLTRPQMPQNSDSVTTSLLGTKIVHRSSDSSRKSEKGLFFLMIAVVILAFIQVIPKESKRILELLYPVETVSQRVTDTSLTVEDRLKSFKIGLYGHQIMKIIVNVCTSIDRSLVFYLYFALNRSFRAETLTIFCPAQLTEKLRQLFQRTHYADAAQRQISETCLSPDQGYRAIAEIPVEVGGTRASGLGLEKLMLDTRIDSLPTLRTSSSDGSEIFL